MEEEGEGEALMVSSEKEEVGVTDAANDDEGEEEQAAAAPLALPLASSLLPFLPAVFSMTMGGAYESLHGKRTSPFSPPTASLLPTPSGHLSVTISSYILCLMAGKLSA